MELRTPTLRWRPAACSILGAVALFTACSPGRTIVAAGSAGESNICPVSAYLSQPEATATDDALLPPGGHFRITTGSQSGPPGPLLGLDTVAVLRVVGRELATQRPYLGGSINAFQPSDKRPGPNPPDLYADAFAHVVRPVLFSAERVLKGKVPACIVFEIPGGVAGDVAASAGRFPDRIRVGDQVLAFMTSVDPAGRPTLLVATEMLLAQPDGSLRIPYGELAVDLDTWTLPPSAFRPVPTVPAQLIPPGAHLGPDAPERLRPGGG